jgi:hypothetical protein
MCYECLHSKNEFEYENEYACNQMQIADALT